MILIAANLVALVALAFIYPEPMVSPGPLVPAHAGLSEELFRLPRTLSRRGLGAMRLLSRRARYRTAHDQRHANCPAGR